MGKYVELSEKERILREIVESARHLAEKRELFRVRQSLVISEKGGLIKK